MINRKKYKKMARSRDCSCTTGKNRDANFNEVIDKLCDKYDKKIKKLERELMEAEQNSQDWFDLA